jgi:retinol dehydrogenase 12
MFRLPRKIPPPVDPVDLRERLCVITGASSGIGFETARTLVLYGAKVVVVGRTPARVDSSTERLRALNQGNDVHGICCDFGCLQAVAELSSQLHARYPSIDVLINNAGVWNQSRKESAQGHEHTFAVNHLAPFALTGALLPLLRRAPSPRIVNVSSRLHTKARAFDFYDPHQRRRRYSGLRAYQQSKLANLLFSRELAEQNKDWLMANAVHPGDVATNVVRDSPFLSWASRTIGSLWLLQPEEGARTSVFAAASPSIEGRSGEYFANCAAARPSRAALDRAQAKRLWKLSEELTEPILGGIGTGREEEQEATSSKTPPA